MKKMKYWTVPEVHFICSQEKPNEKKAPWTQATTQDNGVRIATRDLLQMIG